MFLKSLLAATLLSSAGIALAQDAPPARVPTAAQTAALQAIQSAGASFGQCVSAGIGAVPATVTPEAGATGILATCATQKTALIQAAEGLIATLPEADRAAAQAEMRSEVAQAETSIANAIRQARAPAPAPAPAAAQ